MDEFIRIDKYLATLPPVNPVDGVDFGGLGDLRPLFLSSRHVRILLEELPRAVDLDMGTTLEGLPFISDTYFDRLARLCSLAEEGVAHDILIVDEDLTHPVGNHRAKGRFPCYRYPGKGCCQDP